MLVLLVLLGIGGIAAIVLDRSLMPSVAPSVTQSDGESSRANRDPLSLELQTAPPSEQRARGRASRREAREQDVAGADATPTRLEKNPPQRRAVEPFIEPRDEPPFELVRGALAEAIEADFPSLALSEAQLDELAEVTLRIRRVQTSLRSIPERPDTAERRAALRRRLEGAIVEFSSLTGLSPGAFSARTGSGAGLDDPETIATSGDLSIRPLLRPEALPQALPQGPPDGQPDARP